MNPTLNRAKLVSDIRFQHLIYYSVLFMGFYILSKRRIRTLKRREQCVLPTTMPDLLTNSPDAMFGELIKAPFKQEKKKCFTNSSLE